MRITSATAFDRLALSQPLRNHFTPLADAYAGASSCGKPPCNAYIPYLPQVPLPTTATQRVAQKAADGAVDAAMGAAIGAAIGAFGGPVLGILGGLVGGAIASALGSEMRGR